MAKLSNLRKAIFWLQQAIREDEDNEELLEALNILVRNEEVHNRDSD